MLAQTSTARPRAARVKRLVAAALAVVAALVLAEAGLRVYADLTWQERGVTYDERLGWRMLPDIAKTGNGWCDAIPATTNSGGWRDDEHPLARVPGKRRIVAVGDSFTFGWKVDFGARYTERLEAMLPDTEVVNLGVCAYGPDQELLAYERDGAAYGADVVLWQLFAGNDLDDIGNVRASGWPKPYFRLHERELELVPPQHTWLDRLRVQSDLLEALLAVIQAGRPAKEKAPEWRATNPVPLFRAVARRMKQAVEGDGARLLTVMAHPRVMRPQDRADAMLAVLRLEGIEVLDLVELLRADVGDDLDRLFMADGHWTPAAHERAASAIAADLRRRGWL